MLLENDVGDVGEEGVDLRVDPGAGRGVDQGADRGAGQKGGQEVDQRARLQYNRSFTEIQALRIPTSQIFFGS